MSAVPANNQLARPDRPARAWPRLLRAELLKLRRRRGLAGAAAALTVLPMLVAYAVLLGLHANDPVAYGPAGGVDNFEGAMDVLGSLTAVAAILVGSTLGSGDVGAGVFRELVVTGRSRLALFAARLPAGLGFLLPLLAVAFALSAAASVAFAGSLEAPGGALLARSAGWLVLVGTVNLALAVGVASLVGSRGTSVGLLLGWQLVVAPLLVQIDALGTVREALAPAALARLAPGTLGENALSMSAASAALVLAAWVLVPLVLGAWRTATRDA
jgi:hypothetical protein